MSRTPLATYSSAEEAMFEAEFWVAVAFVIFVGVLGYFGVHNFS
jgi:F0F1-type ATP synthase membrane subunit b/b'